MTDNTQELRERLKRAAPKCYLSAEHLRGARLLPSRQALLDVLPGRGVVAEIGVGFGDFSADILARCRPRRLHLVDAWTGERYGAGRAEVEARFATAIAEGRVVIEQADSLAGLAGLPDRAFDWIYLDTTHTYERTARELDLAAEKVRARGRIAGHDWTSGNPVLPWPYGVIEAANEFCVRAGWRYEFLTMEPHGHLSFCLTRRLAGSRHLARRRAMMTAPRR